VLGGTGYLRVKVGAGGAAVEFIDGERTRLVGPCCRFATFSGQPIAPGTARPTLRP